MTTKKMRPIHPGEILREELDKLGLSARALATALKVPTNRITTILNGRRGITADTALRLARFFGTSPEFWLNLQSAHDLRLAQRNAGDRIVREIKPRRAA
jgi:addiction module HigA family antidote